MLRRFASFIVLALIVLASAGVLIIRAITTNRDPCAEVLNRLPYPTGKNKNLCDFFIQNSDSRQAYIKHIEYARDRCGLSPPPEFLDSLNAEYAEAVQTRIDACDAAAGDQPSEVSARIVISLAPYSSDLDREPCEGLLASALHIVPPDRVWKTFESHHTKKNYCDFLIEYFNSEQTSIDRFESVKAECTVPDWLKTKHAATLQRRTKACDAATIDPDGLVSSYTR